MITRTTVPQFCDLNLASSKDLLQKYSNYLDLFGEFVEQIETSLSYRNTYFKNDTVNDRIKFFNSLTNKIDKFDSEFVAYWFEMANTSPDYIKDEITQKSLNIKSDSIGKFTNARYVLDDSTENIMDFMMNSQRPPDYLPYNNYNKISPWTYQILQRASFRTNSMFRSNIANVQGRNFKSIDAHGVNLVTDTFHFSRTENEYAEYFFDKLKQKFIDEIKIVSYFCNLYDTQAYNSQDTINSNFQKVVEFENLELDIEQVKTKIDFLSNKVVFIKQKVLNDNILSTEKINVVNQPQLTTEEINRYVTSGNLLTRFTEISVRTLNVNAASQQNSSLTTSNEFLNEINISSAEASKSNSSVANDIDGSAPTYTTAQFYPNNVSFPTYQVPEWARGIYECLGVGSIVNAFAGIEDPLSNIDNLLSQDFDLFSVLNTFNPFNTQFLGGLGIDLTSFFNFDFRFINNFDLDKELDNLLNTIQNIDITQFFSAFSLNLPIPSFSLGTLFDFADNFDEIIKEVSDRLLEQIGQAITSFLTSVACGGGSRNSFGGFGGIL